jgi:hypothetical protein
MSYRHSRAILLTVAIASTAAAGCGIVGAEGVPTAADVRAWKQLQPFIFHEQELTGIYHNVDVDAVVFSYRTTLSEVEFLRQLAQRTASQWLAPVRCVRCTSI